MLELNADDMLWLHISCGSAFKAEDHHPVIAGFNLRGEKLYIAHARDDYYDGEFGMPCTVADGASSAVYTDSQSGKRMKTENFRVLVLRHDPIVTDSAGSSPSWRKCAGDIRWKALTTKSALLRDRARCDYCINFQKIKRRSGTFLTFVDYYRRFRR